VHGWLIVALVGPYRTILHPDANDPYVDEEEAAERARRGIWSSRFKMPRDWRCAHRHG
jgi:endonuclease YncB( thermonuclease family)